MGIRALIAVSLLSIAVVPRGWGQTTGNDAPHMPEEVVAALKMLAESGNTEAAYQLAIAYQQGYGATQDLGLAEHWFEAGATTPERKNLVGSEYQHGTYFARNTRMAIRWYEAAGDAGSLFDVARIYQLGDGVPSDLEKSIQIYEKLLKLTGDPYVRRAEFELGNLVIDGRYRSGDPKTDLRWARLITQELIGQEQYKLGASSNGSGMDLATTPEVKAQVVRSAAAYNVDLAQWQMAEGVVVAVSEPEAYAWLRLAGSYQDRFRAMADTMATKMGSEELAQGNENVAGLKLTQLEAGAYYRTDDSLREPDFAELRKDIALRRDPDRQLRLAYHDELEAKSSAEYKAAMEVYRALRDQRVADVRMKIGNEYLLGRDGYPKNLAVAALWYSFAAKAGSAEACRHLAEMGTQGRLAGKSGCKE